jgi:hypothetical protein
MDLLREQRKEQLRKAAQTSDQTTNLHNLTYTTRSSSGLRRTGDVKIRDHPKGLAG